MTRRIALAVIGSVVVALVLSGLGTLVLARAAARRSAVDDLRDQAGAAAGALRGRRGEPRHLQAQAAEPVGDDVGGAPLVPRELGVGVQVAAEVDELVGVLVDDGLDQGRSVVLRLG